MPRPSRETATSISTPSRDPFALSPSGRQRAAAAGRGRLERRHRRVGQQGRGTSVWMGFFLYDVLDDFAPLARPGATRPSPRVARRRARLFAAAIEVGWQGDHYALDFADDGEPIDMPNAMTTGWAAYSGAAFRSRAGVGGARGRPQRRRAEKPHSAARKTVLRAFLALSRPHRRLSPRRARERRPVQPWRVMDRRRLLAPCRQARASGDIGAGRAP